MCDFWKGLVKFLVKKDIDLSILEKSVYLAFIHSLSNLSDDLKIAIHIY